MSKPTTITTEKMLDVYSRILAAYPYEDNLDTSPEVDAIRALILASDRGPGVEMSQEWFRQLCEAIAYNDGTDMGKGIYQSKAKDMLREARVWVKEGK